MEENSQYLRLEKAHFWVLVQENEPSTIYIRACSLPLSHIQHSQKAGIFFSGQEITIN